MDLLKLEELQEFRKRYSRVPVLSLYLPVDGRREKPEEWGARFKNLTRKGLSAPEEAQVREDIRKVTDFLRSGIRDPSARSVIIFSSSAARLWESAVSPFPVPERVVVTQGPVLRPALENALVYGPVGLVLVQRAAYEIGLIHNGTKSVLASGTIEVPKKVSAGGWKGLQMSRIDRKQKLGEERTYREVVSALEPIQKKGGFTRFLLAGPKESLVTLKSVMPPKVMEHLLGEVHLDSSYSDEFLTEKAKEALEAAAAKVEGDAVKRLQAEAAQGRNGVVGLEPTLSAVSSGTAETIVVSREYTAPGGICASCERLTSRAKCEHCGGSIRAVPDILEEAVWRVHLSGGRFVPVLSEPVFARQWGVGALLRFRPV